MDEIEWKLSNSNDPVLIAKTISHLVDLIKDTPLNVDKQLKFLKDKCIDEDIIVSRTASEAVVNLVLSGNLQAANVTTDFMTLLLTTKKTMNYKNVVRLIYKLVCNEHELSKKANGKGTVYKLTTPQHPFVTILLNHPDTLGILHEEVRAECLASLQEDFLRAFYLYVFANPSGKLSNEHCKLLWMNLLKRSDSNRGFLVELMHWLQLFNNPERIEGVVVHCLDGIVKKCPRDFDLCEVSIVWLHSILYDQCMKKHDTIATIRILLEDDCRRVKKGFVARNVCLLLTVRCLTMCPVSYVKELLLICEDLMEGDKLNAYVLISLNVTLLHWLLHSSHLTDVANVALIRRMITKFDRQVNEANDNNVEDSLNNLYESLVITNGHVHFHTNIFRLYRTFDGPDRVKRVRDFLNNCKSIRNLTYLVKLASIFQCLLMRTSIDEEDVHIDCLDILLRCCKEKPSLCSLTLTLLLYKLSTIYDKRSTLHLQLLKAVPKMGMLKENLPLVINTLRILSDGGDETIRLFTIDLYYDLWLIHNRCYPLLKRLLLEKGGNEHMIIKARIVRDLSEKRPELYGTEMVVLISSILNESTGDSGAIASALALDALRHLCIGGVIDISSAWDSISNCLRMEDRLLVLKALCQLASEAANTESSSKVIDKLWQYVVDPKHDDKLTIYALTALSSFDLEQLAENFPLEFQAINAKDTNLLPFSYIAGSSWLCLLDKVKTSALEACGNLMVKHLADEINKLKSHVYDIGDDREEPRNYNYLQPYSLVRALGNYIRYQIKDAQEKPRIYKECLRILSWRYVKPLPACDWCFLQELLHYDEYRRYALTIACRQAIVSNTARNLIENVIVSLTDATETNRRADVETIYENLLHLSNSIQPHVLEPFLKMSMSTLTNVKDFSALKRHCDCLATIVRDDAILDVNKNVITRLLYEEVVKIGDVEDVVAQILLRTMSILPWPIQHETNLNDYDLQIVSNVITNDNQRKRFLSSLDEFLTIVSDRPQLHDYALRKVANYLNTFRDDPTKFQWIVDYLNKIQVNLIGCHYGEKQLIFLCDIFNISAIIFSEFHVINNNYLEERLCMFPQCLAANLEIENNASITTQILEWLRKMTDSDMLPIEYQLCYFRTMSALRHFNCFSTNSKWMKYVDKRMPS